MLIKIKHNWPVSNNQMSKSISKQESAIWITAILNTIWLSGPLCSAWKRSVYCLFFFISAYINLTALHCWLGLVVSPCKEPLHRFGFLKPDKRLNGYLSEKNWLEEHFNPPSQKMINMHGNTGCGVSSPRIQNSIHFVKKKGTFLSGHVFDYKNLKIRCCKWKFLDFC